MAEALLLVAQALLLPLLLLLLLLLHAQKVWWLYAVSQVPLVTLRCRLLVIERHVPPLWLLLLHVARLQLLVLLLHSKLLWLVAPFLEKVLHLLPWAQDGLLLRLAVCCWRHQTSP